MRDPSVGNNDATRGFVGGEDCKRVANPDRIVTCLPGHHITFILSSQRADLARTCPFLYASGMNRYYIPRKKSSKAKLLDQVQGVSRQLRTHFARHLLETGLYAGQENVIELLAAEGALTPGAIARTLGVRPPTITKTVTRLEEQGFVARRPSESDGRQIEVFLTESGEAILESVAKARKSAEAEALSGVKKKDRKELMRLLEMLSDTLETGPSGDVRQVPEADDEDD